MRTILVTLAFIPLFFRSGTSLGVPCADKTWYARNVWDMIYFNEHLFVGCGDTASNAGPINVWTFTAETGWKSEFTVDEEQIDRFTVLNGILTIPGEDSRDSWEFGNYYQRINGHWTKIRNIPGGVHVYDIQEWNDLWIATLGVALPGLAIAVSRDAGESWQTMSVPWGASEYPLNINCRTWNNEWIVGRAMRAYDLFSIGDTLYANTDPINTFGCENGRNVFHTLGFIARFDGTGFVQADVDLFNGLPGNRVVRPVNYDEQTVYIAAETVNSSKWIPLALMSVDDTLHVRQIDLPNCTRPQDIDVFDGVLSVLCNQHTGSDWRVSIQATCDLTTWEERLNLETPTFARSFALAPDALFLGLGGDTDAPQTAQEAVGQILSVERPTMAC